MDLDDVLPEVGECGSYQRLLLWFVLLPGVLPCGFHAYNQLFMAATPPHWCRVPELQPLNTLLNAANVSMEWTRNLSIPPDRRGSSVNAAPSISGGNPAQPAFSQCLMFVRNYTWILGALRTVLDDDPDSETLEAALAGLLPPPEPVIPQDNRTAPGAPPPPVSPCKHGYEYDLSQYTSTVVTEWNLVCDQDFHTTLALVLLGVGGLVGNYVFGYLQDSVGRRPAFFIYLLIECIFGIATAFARDFISWTIFRVGVGFTVPAILGTPYVLAIELVGPAQRTAVTILSNIAYSLALVALAGVVYLVREWRQLALATSVPFLSFFLYWWVLPESPRWLLARGRFQEAEEILRMMARVNGRVLSPNFMLQLKRKYYQEQQRSRQLEDPDAPMDEKNLEETRRYGVMDLVRTPNMRRKTLIITFIWFTNTSVYVGLSYYAPALGGDIFLNFFLAGAVELPTYLFLWPAMLRWGRRVTLCISMVIGGTACLATVLVQNDPVVTLVLYCVGKMGISSSFVVLPLMASELYPTVVRGLGMSTSSVVGMLGPICIPLVNYMGSDMMVLPLLVMGTLLLAGGAGTLLLPETLNQHLPQTLADGENFGKDHATCCTSKVADSAMAEQRPQLIESPITSLLQQPVGDSLSSHLVTDNMSTSLATSTNVDPTSKITPV